jgi:AraC-like DNA-binding protein
MQADGLSQARAAAPSGIANPCVPRRLYLWPHRLLYIGPGPQSHSHRHHAAQFCWGFGVKLRARAEHDQEWKEWNGFRVAPDRPHAFDANAAAVAMLFIEPEGPEYRSFADAVSVNEGIAAFEPSPRASAGLRALCAKGGSIEEADAVCRAWLGLGDIDPGLRPLDVRLVRILRLLQTAVNQPVRLQTLANELNVSPTWLSHRFAQEVGLPLRRYVVWLRLRRAVESVLRGASWTQAAHAAGFSDSAHLSRSFRENFGISPTALMRRPDQISVCFDGG